MKLKRVLKECSGYLFIISAVTLFASPNFMYGKNNKDSSLTFEALMENQITSQENKPEAFRPEHIALNVPDPIAKAKWYVNNLSMEIIRQGGAPNYTTFVGDKGKHIMFELYHNADYPLFDAAKISHMSIHFAFMVSDIQKVKSDLLKAGAALVEDVTKTPSGDLVLMMRDPWGLPIQFVTRTKPMMEFSEFRPEHIALNVPDPIAKAKWFEKNLGYKIVRQGDAPTYTTFIADQNDNMMVELFNNTNYPLLDISNISYMSIHFASVVCNIDAVKENLIKAGAKLAEDVKTTQSGDKVMMLRDPWGQPIQFVTRAVPMLK